MPHRDIIFSGFHPDRSGNPWPDDPGYLTLASNVAPSDPHGYRATYADESTGGAAVAAEPIAAAAFANGTTARHFAGTTDNLYESDNAGTTWNTNSRSGGYDPANPVWDFALFGDTVVAVNGVDEPQEKSLGDAVTTDFADLADSPPIAGRVARVRDHLVLGRLASNQFAIQTSAIGAVADWPAVGSAEALAKQSIFRELDQQYGAITGIVGGEKFGLIFQERAINRMTYVGGNVVYQIDTFERRFGTGLWNGAIQVGAHCYFGNAFGLFRTNGNVVEPLSYGHVDEAVIKATLGNLEAMAVRGGSLAYDQRTDAILWPFTTSGNNEYLLAYYIKQQRFALVDFSAQALPHTIYSVRNSGAEDVATSIPYIFNSSNVLLSMTDITGIVCDLITGYVELAPGMLTQLEGIEIIGTNINSVSMSAKSVVTSAEVGLARTGYNATGSIGRSNVYPIRSTGRFHSFRLAANSDADTLLRGLRVHYKPVSRL
jgi:hypothetical protein